MIQLLTFIIFIQLFYENKQQQQQQNTRIYLNGICMNRDDFK